MSLNKPQQNFESIRENSTESLKIDLALEIKALPLEEILKKFDQLMT